VTARVRVADTERVFDAPEGEDLLEILQRNGHPIATTCGGMASCGHCRLVVVQGKEHLSPIKAEELVHLGNVAKVIGARLACQSRMCTTEGEVVLRIPDVTDVEERKRRKAERATVDRLDRHGRHPPNATGPKPDPRAQTTRATIEWRPARLGGPKNGS
jgi:uncharacterized 2Fe-2S/4Fe-4S cluster protein (DUF4445 family)